MIGVSAESIVKPMWVDNNTYSLGIFYNGSTATCNLSISGASGTTKITNCNVYLKNSSGVTIASWTNYSATGDTLDFCKSTTGVSSGNTYTLSFSATVHRNGNTENISGSTTKKY